MIKPLFLNEVYRSLLQYLHSVDSDLKVNNFLKMSSLCVLVNTETEIQSCVV